MNINPVNNNQVNFKAAYNVEILKTAFTGPNQAADARLIFSRTLNSVLEKNAKGFWKKLGYYLMGKRDAISLVECPGYSHVEKILSSKQTDSTQWLASHLKLRYGLNVDLPEPNPTSYNFPLLTMREKDQYLKMKPQISKSADIFAANAAEKSRQNGVEINREDLSLLKRLGMYLCETIKIDDLTRGNVTNVKIESLDELPEVLRQLTGFKF